MGGLHEMIEWLPRLTDMELKWLMDATGMEFLRRLRGMH